MCTLSVVFRVFPDAPVVVGANRDERLDRASTPPTAWPEEPGIVAPRDEEAGGTWIGYNDAGLLVAVANRWLETDLPSDRSRGLLVRDALRCETADDAAQIVETELRSRRYAGFNLLAADATNAVLLEWDGRLRATPLEPGLHVVMNAGSSPPTANPRRTGSTARPGCSATTRSGCASTTRSSGPVRRR